MAPLGPDQSERSKNCLDQSESRIWPMWLIDVTIAHIWAWKTTWPHRIKNTRTQELNLHSSHSFNDRVKPGVQSGRVWRPNDVTPIFCINTQNKYKVFASWRKESWAGDEAMEYNGWTLSWTMVWSNENGNWQKCLKEMRRRGGQTQEANWMRYSRPLARTRRWFMVQWLTGR